MVDLHQTKKNKKDHARLLPGLPTELIEDIGKRLETKSNISRFRAVCRSWRSSIPPVDLKLQTFSIRILVNDPTHIAHQAIVKETAVYHHHVSPATKDPDKLERHWLVKLHRPILGSGEPHQAMNSLDFRGFELGKAYSGAPDVKLVTSTNLDSPDVRLIFTDGLYHGNLSCVKEGIRSEGHLNLTVDQLDCGECSFEDVIFHRGMFYAVTQFGEVHQRVKVDGKLTKKTISVASPIWTRCTNPTHNRKLRLVESSGDLILVERNQRIKRKKRWSQWRIKKIDFKFKVYKLNVVEKKWVEMQASDLSDRILVVLGDENCSFSVAAKDFPGCQGNCIYSSVAGNKKEVGLFDLSSGTLPPVLPSFSLGGRKGLS